MISGLPRMFAVCKRTSQLTLKSVPVSPCWDGNRIKRRKNTESSDRYLPIVSPAITTWSGRDGPRTEISRFFLWHSSASQDP